MPHNRGTRHKPKYVGVVSYKDHTKWVGTHPTIATYREAEQRCLAELREEVEAPKRNRCVTPTVLEFAGAVIHEDGRVTMSWPDGQRAQKETGRKPSSVRRMREALRRRPLCALAKPSPCTTAMSTSQRTSSTSAVSGMQRVVAWCGPRTTIAAG